MPKKTANKTSKSLKKTSGKKGSEALTQSEVDAVLKSFHRVLRNKGVTQPVQMKLAVSGGNVCPKWRCVTLPNGAVKCGWVLEPC